jgi:hypothetical protein
MQWAADLLINNAHGFDFDFGSRWRGTTRSCLLILQISIYFGRWACSFDFEA